MRCSFDDGVEWSGKYWAVPEAYQGKMLSYEDCRRVEGNFQQFFTYVDEEGNPRWIEKGSQSLRRM